MYSYMHVYIFVYIHLHIYIYCPCIYLFIYAYTYTYIFIYSMRLGALAIPPLIRCRRGCYLHWLLGRNGEEVVDARWRAARDA